MIRKFCQDLAQGTKIQALKGRATLAGRPETERRRGDSSVWTERFQTMFAQQGAAGVTPLMPCLA